MGAGLARHGGARGHCCVLVSLCEFQQNVAMNGAGLAGHGGARGHCCVLVSPHYCTLHFPCDLVCSENFGYLDLQVHSAVEDHKMYCLLTYR